VTSLDPVRLTERIVAHVLIAELLEASRRDARVRARPVGATDDHLDVLVRDELRGQLIDLVVRQVERAGQE